MSQPRYQIFVSSTFQDLEDERQAILNAILKLNQFPAGMEIFPATNDTAWGLIKKVIEDSDYYVLVIGGRYGSMDESGISYTEKEYDFAVSQNIPVLAFLHSDPKSISVGKSEMDSKIRKKLEAFRNKVGKHHYNFWKTTEELKEKVITSLSQSIVMNPQKGWVKAGGIDNTELLSRLADLQQRFDNLVEENNKIKDSALFFDTGQFLQGNDSLSIKFDSDEKDTKEIKLTFNQILLGIGQSLLIHCEIEDVEAELGIFVYECFKKTTEFIELVKTNNKYEGRFRVIVDEESIIEIEIQLQILGVIDVSSIVKQYSGGNDIVRNFRGQNQTYIEKTWQLTEKGRKLYLSQKALRQKHL